MIPLKSKIVFFFFLLGFISNAQTIKQSEIVGNKIISANEINSIINKYKNSSDTLLIKNEIVKEIQYKYSEEGFLNTEVNVRFMFNDSSEKKIRIDVKENAPTIINDIIIHSSDSLETNGRIEDFNFLKGKIFIPREIEEMILNLLGEYEKTGYPFAAVKIENVVFYSDTISKQPYCNLYLQLIQSEKSLIDKIIIEGNTKTKDYVIKRNIRIYEGDEFNSEKIRMIPDILNRLRYFEPVSIPQYYFDQDKKGILNIRVIEKNTNSFDGILGYVPSTNKKEKGYFTGFVNLGFRNLFGTERIFLFKWQKDGRLSQELEINYTEPWIFDFPVNVNLFIWQRKHDSTYVQRKYEGKIDYLLNEEMRLGLILGSESTIPSSTLTNSNISKSNSLIIGGLITYDTRDDIYSPQKGFLFNTSYRYYKKKIQKDEQINSISTNKIQLQKLEFNFAYFLKLFQRQILATSVHVRELKSNFIEESDLYKLGGAFSLRGYIENQFLGNRILWANFEYRYLIEKRSFVFLFFDEGFFSLKKGISERQNSISGFRSGFGVGINLETAIGVLSVSFALAKGDSFAEGKIHFGIVNEF